jgi:hypothetical protein
MNREGALGFALIILLLGGILLFARRPTSISRCAPAPQQLQGTIQLTPVQQEPRRYQNKEIRQIEYNEDHLPVKITITRDYAVT